MSKAFHSFRALLTVLCILSAGFAYSQSSDISPYSRYGIGDLQSQSSVLNFAMGGTGIAYHNDADAPFFINLKNPASYAYGFIPLYDSTGTAGLKMVAFEAGLQDNVINLSSAGQTASSNNAYLSYAALNIPLSRHFGLAMGLVPVSSEGYSITTNPVIDSDGFPSKSTAQNTYQGAGGVNKVFLGAAYAPCKYVSVGGNLSYLFGNLTNTEEINFNNANIFNTLKGENIGLHAFAADFGIMFTVPLWGDWTISAGATFAPAINLTANYNIFTVSQNYVGTNIDTVQDSGAVGRIKIPMMYGGGITIKEGERWTISFDHTVQNWGQFSYFGQTENLSNSYTYGVGVQYVPKKDFPRTYAQGINYRIGYSYSLNYLDLYNTPLMDRNFSAGISLPIGDPSPLRYPAMLNVAFKVGSMGTTTNNLIKENYFQLMVGLTFDDHWFDKHLLY